MVVPGQLPSLLSPKFSPAQLMASSDAYMYFEWTLGSTFYTIYVITAPIHGRLLYPAVGRFVYNIYSLVSTLLYRYSCQLKEIYYSRLCPTVKVPSN